MLSTPEFVRDSFSALVLLQKEAELEEIVRLVGKDTLSPGDRLILEVARSIREDFLHQNAFHEVDTYTSLAKQAMMLSTILLFNEQAKVALERGVDIAAVEKLPAREKIARMKYLTEQEAPAAIEAVRREVEQGLKGLEAA